MPASLAPRSLARVRIPVDGLQYGMFVAELDRPWLDTPFLIEGLLLSDEAELTTLRRFCRFVYVDLGRSTDEAAGAIRRAALHDRSNAAGGPGAGRSAFEDGVPTHLAGDLGLPRGMKVQHYPAPVPIAAELPRARQSWARGRNTLRALMLHLRDDARADLRDDARADQRDVDEVADGLVESMIETPDAMLWVARMRDEQQSTYQHCLKVALYLIALGRQMGFPRADLVRLGQIGMLADVGKIKLPRALLEKPGLLTPTEHTVVRKHVQLGIDALRKSMTLDPLVEQGIMQHHERLDGSGYPRRLKGKEIGIFGRMTAIADCFAALVVDRPYAKALSPQDALLQMYEWCGASFHGPLVEQFVQAIGVFPVGSLVELSNGEVAIVLAHNRVHRLEPRVLVIAGADKSALARPFERDLLTAPADQSGHPTRIARGLPAGAFGLKPADYYAENRATCDGLVFANA